MFFGYNFPKLEPVVEILNISDGPRCAVTQEKWGKWPSGSAVKPQPTNPGCQNVFCNFSFFWYQGNAAFRPLILHRFRPFLQRAQCSHCKRCISYGNSVRPSVCPSVHPSVTRRYCVKTTARSTMQFSPLDSKMCLVL